MRTELPTERLQRRLGADSESDADSDGEKDTSLSRWLPDTAKSDGMAGWVASVRADPGRAGVIALAVVGVIAVLVTVFTLVRDKAPAVASAKLPPVEMVSSASPTPGPAPPDGDGPVIVSVVGLVHKPGLVTLAPGARIADALTAAGGALDGADLIGLNMARRVADGEQIVVGIVAAPGQPAAMGSSISSGPATAAADGCTVDRRKGADAARFGGSQHRHGGGAGHVAGDRSGDRGGDHRLARRQRAIHQRRPTRRRRRHRACAAGEAA